jgi:hypothetical protein
LIYRGERSKLLLFQGITVGIETGTDGPEIVPTLLTAPGVGGALGGLLRIKVGLFHGPTMTGINIPSLLFFALTLSGVNEHPVFNSLT